MKKTFIFITIILMLNIFSPDAFSAEGMLDTINQELSPQNYGNSDKVTEKIESLNYNINDFPELEIRGSDRTINKSAAFHCYKMRNRSSYPQTWIKSGTDVVFSDAIELTLIPICDDDSPSGYIYLKEKEDGSNEIEARGPRMSGSAYMAWMDHIVDRFSLERFLKENEITSLTDIKCVLGSEEQGPDFIYLNTDKGEFVIPYFNAGDINNNGELIILDDFLQSYDRYIKSKTTLLPNYLNGSGGTLSGYLTCGILVFVILGLSAIIFFIFFRRHRKLD